MSFLKNKFIKKTKNLRLSLLNNLKTRLGFGVKKNIYTQDFTQLVNPSFLEHSYLRPKTDNLSVLLEEMGEVESKPALISEVYTTPVRERSNSGVKTIIFKNKSENSNLKNLKSKLNQLKLTTTEVINSTPFVVTSLPPSRKTKRLNIWVRVKNFSTSASHLIWKKSWTLINHALVSVWKNLKWKTRFTGLILVFTLGVSTWFLNSLFLGSSPEVAGIQAFEAKTEKLNDLCYEPLDFDTDGDGLSDKEECEIGSRPDSSNTCSSDLNDVQVLMELKSPADCQSIDLDSEEEVKTYSRYINLASVADSNTQTNQEVKTQSEVEPETLPDSPLLSTFGVGEYSDIVDSEPEKVIQQAEKQAEYLDQIEKIESYLETYRSYAIHDRSAPLPVHPAIFLDTALSCPMPVEYLLTLARLESNFGTNIYNPDGSLNRIGRHKNMFSFGLTDGGRNWTMDSWEAVFPKICQWYKRLKARGLSNRQIWKIYNPNGDYPTKVENMAARIRAYLNS